MKNINLMKVLLVIYITMLVSICGAGNAVAGNPRYDSTSGEWVYGEGETSEDSLVAYIYSEVMAELGNSLLDANFATTYFGVDILKVEDLTSTTRFAPEDMGLLYIFTLAETQNISDAIKAMKASPAIEYVQVNGLTDYRYDFRPGGIFLLLDAGYADKYGNFFSNAAFASSKLGLNIKHVKLYSNNSMYLTLEEESKQSVLDAIVQLNQNPNVRSAEINGIVYDAVK